MTHVRTIAAGLFLGLIMMANTGWITAEPIEELNRFEPEITELPDGLHVAWHLPPAVFRDGAWTVDQFATDQTAGHYELPLRSFGIALPADADPTLTVLDVTDSKPIRLNSDLRIAPKPEGIERDADGSIVGGGFLDVAPLVEQPSEIASLQGVGTMAGVRLARLEVRPLIATANGQQLQSISHVELKIEFNSSIEQRTGGTRANQDLNRELLQHVINPSHLDPLPRQASKSGLISNRPTVFIETDETAGMVKVSYAELQAAGFPVEAHDLTTYRLYRGDSEIAWHVIGSGANADRLETGESLVFYAPAKHSRWMVGQVFKLVADFEPGRQFASISAAPASFPDGARTVSVVAEEDLVYTPQCFCGSLPLGRDGDRWIWKELKRPNAASADFAIETPDFDSGQKGKLNIWFIGFTDLEEENDHRARVELNGQHLGTLLWDGKAARQGVFDIPAGLLAESNSVTVILEETDALFDGVWVDAIQIDYVLADDVSGLSEQLSFRGENSRSEYEVAVAANQADAFDVTDPDAPILLNNTQLNNGRLTFADGTTGTHFYQITPFNSYLRPSRVRAAEPLAFSGYGASYLVITADEFENSLDDLVALRTEQGHRVGVESVSAIYDQFGHGQPDPAAIQAFLKHAWESWSPPPQVVVLVGDGHFDPRQNLAGSAPSLLPPYLVDTDPWMGETAADNRFVTMDGPDDQLPEMAIGRLPVNSTAELEIIIEKMKTHAAQNGSGNWLGTFTLVSDDTDEAGNFEEQSNEIIQTFMPAPWRTQHYVLHNDAESGDSILSSLKSRWNTGHSMVMFTGHSSFDQWAVERMFHEDEISSLPNTSRLPLVMSMSCFTSSFHYPENDVLDEQFIRTDGGALVTWGATGLGVSTGHDSLSAGFLETILNSDQSTVGSAAMAGKLQLVFDQSAHSDLLDTFTLLGDPATQMGFTKPEEFYSLYLPVSVR